MKRERIPGTQATLFDELPTGQRLLFNGIAPPKRRGAVVPQSASLVEQIDDELKSNSRQPLPGNSRLF